jgi:hypothetical protein
MDASCGGNPVGEEKMLAKYPPNGYCSWHQAMRLNETRRGDRRRRWERRFSAGAMRCGKGTVRESGSCPPSISN